MGNESRQSNIELLRIFMMLVIIAHHYVLGTGIMREIQSQYMDYNQPITNINSLFALCFGWGGKTAINVFILITGYYMCVQQFRYFKVMYLYIQVKLYTIAIFILFLFLGYETIAMKNVLTAFLGVAYKFPNGFIPAFILLYLLVPFLNKLIGALKKNELFSLVVLLLIFFSVLPTLLFNAQYSYIAWYVTVYLIGAYIRLYMPKFLESRGVCFWLVICSLLFSWISILVIARFLPNFPCFCLVSDSNKLLAIITAVALFCLFRTINIGTNSIVNALSSVTFGVLLIHSNSAAVRHWLWRDVLQGIDAYHSSFAQFVLHAILSVLGVYFVCVAIALLCRKIFPIQECMLYFQNKKKI